ncbi:MAG: DUF3127 domain-containing protein [Bacteroidota bacterium]|nr:DUF3127 domain-containing protein [Bacteroidota bacterium]
MSYELSGKLIAKYDTVQRTETFKTREFVVEKSEEINGRIITNYVKFQSVQDRTNIIDKLNIGDEVKVYFNIKGSKWEKNGQTNYITNLDAWRIEQMLQTNTAQSADDGHLEPLDTFSSAPSDVVDDLPF